MKFHVPQGGLVDGWGNCLGITWWLQYHVGRMHQNACGCALSRFPANDDQCMAFDAGVRLAELFCCRIVSTAP